MPQITIELRDTDGNIEVRTKTDTPLKEGEKHSPAQQVAQDMLNLLSRLHTKDEGHDS